LGNDNESLNALLSQPFDESNINFGPNREDILDDPCLSNTISRIRYPLAFSDSKEDKDSEPAFDKHNFELRTFIAWNPVKCGIKRVTKRPNYIYFDHGDHFHVLYCTGSTNKRRTVSRITQDLGIDDAIAQQALISDTAVDKNYKRFVYYLLRKGMKTWTVASI
jgi:hypothetical protein